VIEVTVKRIYSDVHQLVMQAFVMSIIRHSFSMSKIKRGDYYLFVSVVVALWQRQEMKSIAALNVVRKVHVKLIQTVFSAS